MPKYSPVADVDTEVIFYIMGSCLLKMPRKCKVSSTGQLCLEAAQTENASTTFIDLKDYAPGALKRARSNVLALLSDFESCLRMFFAQQKVPLKDVRKMLLASFLADVSPEIAEKFVCSQGHNHALYFLNAHAVVRIFQIVKTVNADLKSEKKGAELIKSHRLNM